MMFVKTVFQLGLIFLLVNSGALQNSWSVLVDQKVCALEGSTVTVNGTSIYPTVFKGVKALWGLPPEQGKELNDLRNEPGYSSRVEYLGDEVSYISLRLSDVKKSDEHMYCFKLIIDDVPSQHCPGFTLSVTDLQVIVPAELIKDESAVLTCKTKCFLNGATYVWYKNGLILTGKITKNNNLYLEPYSSEDAGSYSCAVKGYKHRPSPAEYISERYGPRYALVSTSPSTKKMGSSSVNLTCSSDAKPPVETYTWFKENEASPVGSGQSYRALQSGLYYCEAQNIIGFKRSAAVSITINESDGTVIVYVAVGLGLFGLAALLSVLFWLRWRRQKKKADEGDHQNVGMSDKDDTYASLNPAGQKSDDVYHTLTVSHPSPPDDTLTSD